MRLKTKIKWKFYNSLLSVFLIRRFQIWLQFSKEELLEIPFVIGSINSNLIQLYKKHEVESFSLILDKNNEISIWYFEKNNPEKIYTTLCFTPNYNLKSKFAYWICL